MTRKIIGMLVAATVGFLSLAAGAAMYLYLSFGNQLLAEQQPQQTIKVFFGNSHVDPQVLDCQRLFAVARQVPVVEEKTRAALEQLLAGPLVEEKAAGYYSSINYGVKINSLTVNNGVARVDFDGQMEQAVGGSCRVAAIRSQITQTLTQFPEIKSVVISVDGRVEDALQP